MAKEKKIYVCDSCGNEFLNWQGRCPACGDWNSLKEIKTSKKEAKKRKKADFSPKKLSKVDENTKKRLETGIDELDRVLGRGFVTGALVLLAGEPGVGKSTLLLQIADKINGPVLYVSGEESEEQIKIRSKRLKIDQEDVDIMSTQNVSDIDPAKVGKYNLIMADSIQTLADPQSNGQIGGVVQVKASAYHLQSIAKKKQVPVILSGQITKQGRVAGPKTLEHLVDTVLYLEGDENRNQRILRAIKNRFGSTGETGIFQMKKEGLEEIKDPSKLFLKEKADSPGSVITAVMEGQRPLLVEVQALTEKTVFGYPKRRAKGIPQNRLEVLSAIISKRTNTNLSNKDIYVNIIGGLDVKEPAVDLSICLAVISSVKNKPVKEKLICLGEVGLSGELRTISELEKRLREARKLGYKKAVIPKIGDKKFVSKKMDIKQVGTLKSAVSSALK